MRYPWVAIILVLHWAATTYTIITARKGDVTQIIDITFLATIIYAHIGFKVPKG